MSQDPTLLNRRHLVAGLGAMAALPAQAAEPISLGEAAASRGILFGAAAGAELLSDEAAGALHARHSRLFTLENAMKFDWLNPKDGPPDFTHLDALLSFARARKIRPRGTALIWNDNVPGWLKGRSGTEITRAMEMHLEAVCSRYNGQMHSYDVVNEPFYPPQGQPGGYRQGPFLSAMGEDYIFRAFKRVASLDKAVKLNINEAFCEHETELGLGIRPRLLTLIDKILDRGIKLDAVGLQAHLQPGVAYDGEAVARFFEEIAKRKVKIYLTELDVDDQRLPREQTKRDWMVAQFAQDFLTTALANPAVEVVISWGLSDRYTWYRNPEVAAQRKRDFAARALPFDENYREKPLALALRAALLAAPKR